VKHIDVDRTNKALPSGDQYNITTSDSSQQTSQRLVDEHSHEGSPWSPMKFSEGMLEEAGFHSERGEKPNAVQSNSTLHKPEDREQFIHYISDDFEVKNNVNGLRQEHGHGPLRPNVEKTNERSSVKNQGVDCAGHWKPTNISRQAHQGEVLDTSADCFSEDLLFDHSPKQELFTVEGLHSEEMTALKGRVHDTSLRHAGQWGISTIRQFDAEEVKLVKDSSLQEQAPAVQLHVQVPNPEDYQFSTPNEGLFDEGKLKNPYATPSVLPLPPKLRLRMRHPAKPDLPEHLSQSTATFQAHAQEPSSQHNMYGGQDVLDYETMKDSSTLGEHDAYQGMVLMNSSQPLECKIDSPHGENVMEWPTPDAGQISGSHPTEHGFLQPSPETSRHSAQAHQFNPHFQGQDSAYSQHPSVMELPESSCTWSTKGCRPGNQLQGSSLVPVQGQATYHRRLRINTMPPEQYEQLHVVCRHCNMRLQVPPSMPNSDTRYQKLRCGACWKISRFQLYPSCPSVEHSPAASSENISPAMSCQFRPNDTVESSGTGRNRGIQLILEPGLSDREVVRTHSSSTLAPSGRRQQQAPYGSKLSHMFTAPTTSHRSTSSSSGDLGPPEATGEVQGRSSYTSDDRIAHVSHAPASSSVDHDSYIAAADRLGKKQDGHPPQGLKYLESSSDSEDDGRASSLMLTVDPPAVEQFETPEFNHEEHEDFKGFRGFLKKSVKELRKGKSVSQFRRKVIINSHAVPDMVVKKAEDLAGPIHPGSYWYDVRAGFWGVMGGPCLGMIPPFIEVLNYPMARHCSNGKTGVLVNGRELHWRDLELLKQRGLPGTPGKAYNLDIDGRLFEARTGTELMSLGRLAPTLERTGRGPGMGVPGSN